ncbi:histone promoter control 2 (HPC2) [Fusarium albosuccineum]|uniref:Histone promoter control 2 (HPC2) n=1 Tax=Fusarium albosuccineum TaxID=1237068 RepID=A0A8H4LR49_9HYPO|nr:histone promoter control 2 (HPC2) [Fusarium albosuccineum]
MAATAGDTSMSRYDSSAGELSSPPSGSLSEPGSPSRNVSNNRAPQEYDEIIVVSSDGQLQHISHQNHGQPRPQPPPPPHSGTGPPKRYALVDNQWVQLTAAGVPRKKPGRKPGTIVKPRNSDGADVAKAARKPRKPRDPNAPPMQRKRKIAPADTDNEVLGDSKSLAAAASSASIVSRQPRASDISNVSASSPAQQQHQLPPSSHQSEQRYSPKIPKREHFGSMQSILNSDPPAERPQSQPQSQSNNSTAIPVRTSGQSYDPIRGNYDPVRETMVSHNPYGSASGSPRAPSQMPNRSPTIASLLGGSDSRNSYQPSSNQPRFQAQEPSQPPSPSKEPQTISTPTPASRSLVQEVKKDPPPPPPPVQRPVIRESNFTTISNGPIKRASPKQKPHTGVSTPKTDNLDDMQESEGRSILDFGRAKPGEETQAPTIILSVPIQAGETNKYVNFMRMAEDRYGWDALHPRLAANRDRKARIAAAAASLEKAESGRESGDEMSVDLSDAEASNPDNGGTSGPDAQAKPKKKRNFKEDQYDVDDDFVDDSELLWEAQAAASRDGFFVYSGPLVPEVEKPAAGHEGPPKRGRGGRGSRGGGRGASTRGTGTGRGGGPGSRGGSVTRKPRITKQEKAQREREKAERESMAQLAKTPSHGYSLNPTTPSFAVSELGA